MTKQVGTKPYQTPRNADLGTLAYQDHESVEINALTINKLNSIDGDGATINFSPNTRSSSAAIGAFPRGADSNDIDIRLGDENGWILTANAGRVGIGYDNVSPVQTLDVDGSIGISGTEIFNSSGEINGYNVKVNDGTGGLRSNIPHRVLRTGYPGGTGGAKYQKLGTLYVKPTSNDVAFKLEGYTSEAGYSHGSWLITLRSGSSGNGPGAWGVHCIHTAGDGGLGAGGLLLTDGRWDATNAAVAADIYMVHYESYSFIDWWVMGWGNDYTSGGIFVDWVANGTTPSLTQPYSSILAQSFVVENRSGISVGGTAVANRINTVYTFTGNLAGGGVTNLSYPSGFIRDTTSVLAVRMQADNSVWRNGYGSESVPVVYTGSNISLQYDTSYDGNAYSITIAKLGL